MDDVLLGCSAVGGRGGAVELVEDEGGAVEVGGGEEEGEGEVVRLFVVVDVIDRRVGACM